MCLTGAMQKYDSAPEGWEGTVEAMKGKPEISNPFALAHWMAEQGYHPHDGLHADVLDAAHQMYCDAGYGDEGDDYAEEEGDEENEDGLDVLDEGFDDLVDDLPRRDE